MLTVINIGPLLVPGSDRRDTCDAIRRACRDTGFFYAVGHQIDEGLQARLESLSRDFFALPLENKLAIRMERGGRAWRGYFPVGAELTSGRPDQKEGLYLGAELGEEHPKVQKGTPLFGRNLFPAEIPALRETVLEYMTAMTRLGHALMEGIASSLGLEASYFADRYTREPLILFRIFNYPAQPGASGQDAAWGVGEHTDYGLLTIVKQDDTGGLEVKTAHGWVEASPIPNAFVCNIGDMLDRMTGGYYKSTPHRVRHSGARDRLSFPFFFDPNFDAEVVRIESAASVIDDKEERWDKASVHEFRGTYGDYLLSKVSKVFPQLKRQMM